MMEQHLSGMKARKGTTLFACITCKTAPTFAFRAADICEAVHVMLCPKWGIARRMEFHRDRDNELGCLATSPETRGKSHFGTKKQHYEDKRLINALIVHVELDRKSNVR